MLDMVWMNQKLVYTGKDPNEVKIGAESILMDRNLLCCCWSSFKYGQSAYICFHF